MTRSSASKETAQESSPREQSMPKEKSPGIKVKTYATHHVITQPNPLRSVLQRVSEQDVDDPVARAEQALAGLSGEFKNWMLTEADRLMAAYAAIVKHGFSPHANDELFRAAHDIKGQAATLGFPLVASVAESLCRLIEETKDPQRIPLDLVDQHVDAVRAIVREHGRPQAISVAAKLTNTLRLVCEDFLKRQEAK